MKRVHVITVALLLGVAAVLGVVAASRTAAVRVASHSNNSNVEVAARAQRLDRVEAALRKALRDRPPALPRLPSTQSPATASAGVVYRRPAPIVVLKHAPHGDDGGDQEAEGAGGSD
jgi:hypothetical protein